MSALESEFAGCPRVGQPQPWAPFPAHWTGRDGLASGLRMEPITPSANACLSTCQLTRTWDQLLCGGSAGCAPGWCPGTLWTSHTSLQHPGDALTQHTTVPSSHPSCSRGALMHPPVQRWWGDMAVHRSCTQLWSIRPQDWGGCAASARLGNAIRKEGGGVLRPQPLGRRTRLGVE